MSFFNFIHNIFEKCQQQDVLDKWKLFVKNRAILKDKNWKLSNHWLTHCTQDDSRSCGVFVCYFFEKIINAEFKYLTNYFEVSDYRAYIREKILRA